jgi:hypothetical protein
MAPQRLEQTGTMIGDTLAHASHRAAHNHGKGRSARNCNGAIVNDGPEMI